MIARDFQLRAGGEYTLEVSPETVTREKLTIAREFGVNRISMGVESFDDHLLQSIKRRHDKQLVSETVAQFRECGFEHIDLDLIRNLPGSSQSTLKTDVDGITELGVPSVTSYEYVVKPKSIDVKRYAKGGLDVVARRDAVFTHLLFSMAMESLGYAQRPLGWFLKDTSHQYEQQLDKWERGYDLIPIGVSGYGYVHGVQFINHEGYEPYCKALDEGRLPIEKGAVLDAAEQAHRRAVFGFRTLVDRQELVATYGVDIFDDRGEARATVDKLIDMGLVEQVGSAYRLSQLGHLFQDQIQMEFYSRAYKDRETSRMAALRSGRLPIA
jgi:oxygen-independent coproporphyrinogen-3 oxidase